MTTLPQTTPIRLPRAGNSSQLAVPANNTPVSGVAAPAIQMSGADVWRVLRANLWLIILFVTIGAVGGYFINGYLELHYSTWTAEGRVRLVAPESLDPTHPAAGFDGNTLLIMQNTEVQRLRSETVLDNILKESDNPIRQTNWWKVVCGGDPQKAHQLFSKNLIVQAIPDTQLITVRVAANDQNDCTVLVQALVDRTIADEKQINRNKTDAEHAQLLERKTSYERELRTKSAEVKDLADQLARQGQGDRGQFSTPAMELNVQVSKQIELQSQKLSIESALNSFKDKIAHGETPDRVSQMVDQDHDVVEYKSILESLDNQIATETTKGSGSPQVKQLNQQRSVYQNKLEDIQASKTNQYQKSMLADLTTQHDSIVSQSELVDSRIASLKSDIADLSTKSAQLLLSREEEASLREYVTRYENELKEIDQAIRARDEGVLAWDEKPLPPDERSFPKLLTTMSSAIFIGLFLSLGIAFLREITDTTVRSPRDILRVGQMNLLGMVPHEADDPQSAGARLPLVIFEAPHSMMAEQLRQVRTRLQHAASLDTTRSILVTSPGPGDGKSTIAVNLAAGLALNGRRILLVDSNFRRPELHRIFGIGNEGGFSDVLNDVNAFSGMVRETSVPNLSVMASGPKPSNPTELLESQLLLDFIERALEEYDHVIFDSGPMLFVSESVALAPRVDGVVTVVKARTSSRGVLQRMRDGLRAVKAEHLGVVLNGVRSQAGGYYGRSIKTYYEYQSAD
jgi:capsular exopolysaccharide synthesis family protein